MYKLLERNGIRYLISKDYNFIFNTVTGFFARWGKTKEEDPSYCRFGCEILDIEITTKCNGINGKLCTFCYKANTPNGKNMSFETFKTILDKMPLTLTQIAFGADSECTANPDLWKMMQYCRERKPMVVPNITVANISDKTADRLHHYCGAVAVSRYDDKNICYDSVKKLTDRGMDQVNIHIMISSETFDQVMETLNDKLIDPRLAKLNAIVLLSLKKKGRGIGHTPLPQEKFNGVVDFAMSKNIPIGFDSCSAMKFLKAIENHPNKIQLEQMVEPCESSCFSSYINVDGKYFPCSFMEDSHPEWKEQMGLDVVNCKDFLIDIWNSAKNEDFRRKVINCRDKSISCNFFKV